MWARACQSLGSLPTVPPLLPPFPAHRVQSADANDPWLQGEWGETLVDEEGRVGEGLLHLQVSAAMLLGAENKAPVKALSLEGARCLPACLLCCEGQRRSAPVKALRVPCLSVMRSMNIFCRCGDLRTARCTVSERR